MVGNRDEYGLHALGTTHLGQDILIDLIPSRTASNSPWTKAMINIIPPSTSTHTDYGGMKKHLPAVCSYHVAQIATRMLGSGYGAAWSTFHFYGSDVQGLTQTGDHSSLSDWRTRELDQNVAYRLHHLDNDELTCLWPFVNQVIDVFESELASEQDGQNLRMHAIDPDTQLSSPRAASKLRFVFENLATAAVEAVEQGLRGQRANMAKQTHVGQAAAQVAAEEYKKDSGWSFVS